ncbi:hypothetical protein GCM10007902_16880 [Dyella nitratireducens]|nr:hypothetical protein GCM10007902_16880 [Dyella nitratireducens]
MRELAGACIRNSLTESIPIVHLVWREVTAATNDYRQGDTYHLAHSRSERHSQLRSRTRIGTQLMLCVQL